MKTMHNGCRVGSVASDADREELSAFCECRGRDVQVFHMISSPALPRFHFVLSPDGFTVRAHPELANWILEYAKEVGGRPRRVNIAEKN